MIIGSGVFGFCNPCIGTIPEAIEELEAVASELVRFDRPNLRLILAPADPDLGRGVNGRECGVDEDTEIIDMFDNCYAFEATLTILHRTIYYVIKLKRHLHGIRPFVC